MTMNQTTPTFNKTVLGAAIAMAITSASVTAATYNFSVTSIANAAISERQPLSFGTELKLSASGICSIPTPVAGDEWDLTTGYAVTPAANTGVAAVGAGCADVAATTSNKGHYLITGATSANVKVTVSSGASTDGTSYTFLPTGIIDNDDTASGGSTAIVADIEQTVALDANGAMGVLVGGSLTIGGTDLAASTTYPGTFDINVTY